MYDTLSVMLEQESAYSCRDYLDRNDGSSSRLVRSRGKALARDNDAGVTVRNPLRGITPEDRAKLVHWCYDVADQCRLDGETVAAAMGIVDRFMSVGSGPAAAVLDDRDAYQLLTVSALYVSIKVNERVAFSSVALSEVTRGMYSAEEIEATELSILSALDWRLCAPTPLAMGHQILNLLRQLLAVTWHRARAKADADGRCVRAVGQPTYDFLHDELAHQTELAVGDYPLATVRPSVVAVASLLNAVERVGEDYDRELLRRGLLCILVELSPDLPADAPQVIDEARLRLAALVREDGEGDGYSR